MQRRWIAEEGSRIRVEFPNAALAPYSFRILSVDKDVLRMLGG